LHTGEVGFREAKDICPQIRGCFVYIGIVFAVFSVRHPMWVGVDDAEISFGFDTVIRAVGRSKFLIIGG
jgi:hypothetical protein